MIDGTGNPQRILLVGASSEIGLATVRELTRGVPQAHVVLAGRASPGRAAAAQSLSSSGLEVSVVDFEATDRASHRAAVDAAFGSGDVDVALVAIGVLGDQESAWQDVDAALNLAEVNYVAPVSLGVLLAQRMREQGHGTIVAFSSVSAERPRRSNFGYGSTKSGADSFYIGLGEALRGDAVNVLVVRPGFVHTKMTRGLQAPPLAQTPEQVATTVGAAVRSGKRLVWAPAELRWVMCVLRHLPAGVWRRLPV